MRRVLTCLGAMSGTSLDGVDAAVIRTDGTAIHDLGPSAYRPYTDAERETIRAALGHWDGEAVEAAARVVLDAHAEVLSGFDGIDLVGFHGQTLAHDPRGRGTLQVGDGQALADRLRRPVVWDFRTADVRLGGEGAPLAPYYHHALARWADEPAPVAVLNLGGIGNLTWLDPTDADPVSACLAFDTGPANAPIDDLMRRRRGARRDEDGALAASGTVDADLLDRVMGDAWFDVPPPKSLDRNAFAATIGDLSHLSDADAAATLSAVAAGAVVRALDHLPSPPVRLLVTGGGRWNLTLMAMLATGLDLPVAPIDDWGVDGDMVEAQAFGYLASRVASGRPTSGPRTTGVAAAIGGGTLSHPRR